VKSEAKPPDIDQLLQGHGLKKTPLRKKILSILICAKKPLSQGDLISKLSQVDSNIDRVTVYRNLSSLKASGLLHEVSSNHYVFCSHECHDHAHLLFYCQACHQHQEISDHRSLDQLMSALAKFKFFGQQQPIFMSGVCTSCTNLGLKQI
jgi:Fur family transcriptional regulator, zinc uptake regulator